MRSIHNLESSYFRTKFESELPKFKGSSGIGIISDTDPQPIVINSHLGKIAVLDGSGWVYYRTPAELFGDLGIANAIKSYVDTAIVAAINSAY